MNKKLWPVTLGVGLLMTGSVAVEFWAAQRGPNIERIQVTGTQLGADEGGPELLAEQFGSALSDAHLQARELVRRGNLTAAAEVLAQVANAQPAQPMLRAERAHVLLRLSRHRDALALLESVVREVVASPVVTLDLALCYDALERGDQAREVLQAGLALHPSHSGIRQELGELLRRQNRLQEAIEVLEPAARHGSNDERASALASLGRCYMEMGKRSQASAAFDQAIERAPASINTWVRVTRGLLQSSEPDDQARALEHAQRAVRLGPELPLAHSVLGQVHEALGSGTQAVEDYRQALRLDPGYAFARRRLVRLSLESEEFRQARDQAEALLQLGPDVSEHQFLAGLVASRSGDMERARQHYRRAIDSSQGRYPEAFYNLGLLERQAKDAEAAIAAYEQAIFQRPDFKAAHNNLGLVHLDQRDFAAARAAFRRAIEVDPRYVPAWTNLARCLSLEQKAEEAIDAYKHALELSPLSRSLTVDYAVALRRAGRVPEAIALYEQLLQADPRYVTGWYNLGIALEAAGRGADGKQAYERALSLDPTHVKSLKRLAHLEAALGLGVAARDHIREALDHDPSDADLRLEFAELLLAQNDHAACSQAVQLVLKQAPERQDAKALLSRCALNQ